MNKAKEFLDRKYHPFKAPFFINKQECIELMDAFAQQEINGLKPNSNE